MAELSLRWCWRVFEAAEQLWMPMDWTINNYVDVGVDGVEWCPVGISS